MCGVALSSVIDVCAQPDLNAEPDDEDFITRADGADDGRDTPMHVRICASCPPLPLRSPLQLLFVQLYSASFDGRVDRYHEDRDRGGTPV